MNHNDDRETKIIGINNINIITNGTIQDLEKITDPNQIGQVIYKDTNEVKSEITPLIIIINQGKKNYKQRLDVLIENGGNMDKIVNYNKMSSLEIAKKYRKY